MVTNNTTHRLRYLKKLFKLKRIRCLETDIALFIFLTKKSLRNKLKFRAAHRLLAHSQEHENRVLKSEDATARFQLHSTASS